MRVLLVQLGCDRPELNEPLAIACLDSALQGSGLEGIESVQIWDKLEPYRIKDLLLQKWDLICFSLEIGSMARFRAWYRECQARCPRTPVLVGNVIPIHAYEALLKEFPSLYCCIGEGEPAVTGFARLIKSGGAELTHSHLVEVPNIAYVAPGSDLPAVTPRISADLESCAPLRRPFLDRLKDVGGIARVEASRGCHWGRCEFCSVATRFGEGSWRDFSNAWILEELRNLSDHGISHPYFSDEDFFGQRYEHSIALAKEIISAKQNGKIRTDMSFFISALSADLKSPAGLDAIQWWMRAGLREVFLGVEAGDNAQLRVFGKKARSLTNRSAVDNVVSLGLQVDIGFIMFEPGSSLESLKCNIEFLKSLDLSGCDSRVVKRLRVQPMTAIVERYRHLIVGELDIDQQEYPYRFKDSRVQQVWDRYSAYEGEQHKEIDRLLAGVRGEVSSEMERLEGKRRLASIRDLDLEILDIIVSQAGDESSLALDSELSGLVQRRKSIVSRAVECVP
jgi:radical SAM superfamily enzyme YgiQ (UPF0313 family)